MTWLVILDDSLNKQMADIIITFLVLSDGGGGGGGGGIVYDMWDPYSHDLYVWSCLQKNTYKKSFWEMS